MHDFFIGTYHRHLSRTGNYVGFVFFLSQKGFFKDKKTDSMYICILKALFFLDKNEDLDLKNSTVSLGAICCQFPTGLIFPFMCFVLKPLHSFLLSLPSHLSKFGGSRSDFHNGTWRVTYDDITEMLQLYNRHSVHALFLSFFVDIHE